VGFILISFRGQADAAHRGGACRHSRPQYLDKLQLTNMLPDSDGVSMVLV
jgi:hypothetical protein